MPMFLTNRPKNVRKINLSRGKFEIPAKIPSPSKNGLGMNEKKGIKIPPLK